ncbi:hypothetical protein OG978_44395 (plasmid) [Streptomyces sp. NBC_01591]|uniref:hypothetical protein n=1 Tax=Streptomyces sp. NBC_01591 TaxID=2975888 RepID=UPI002DDBDB0A|nr:hypothetical protein [Streptomyces sp. NBC_01591]WSD74161.1 hypothetical protein OG978_44395 [Streptomyces sp. NBC_01591]
MSAAGRPLWRPAVPEDTGHLRSYLGAYTGTFRTGDTVHVAWKLVHLHNGDHTGFGVELTPWNTGTSYLANLTG